MLVNIMEVIEKEDLIVKKTPFIDRNLWLQVQERLIDERTRALPTIAMCLECDGVGECKYTQVEVTGFYYYYCGIKNKEWRK